MVGVSIRISPRLEAIPRYEPGLTTAEVLARYGMESAVKLASNESPFPPLPEVVEVVAAGVGGLNRYPDGPARALRRALAERHGVGPGRGGHRQRLLRAHPHGRPGAARSRHDDRPGHALVLALRPPGRDGRRPDRGGPARRRRRPRPRRHGGGGGRAHPPGDRLQPQQPHRGVPLGRRHRALRRRPARGPRDPDRRGLLRLRGPPRRGAHAVDGARAAQPARDAHLQQGARPVRPARGLRHRRIRLDRRHRQGAPALQHQHPRAGRGAREPAAPVPARAARPRGHGASARGCRRRWPRRRGPLPPARPTLSWCGRIRIRPPDPPVSTSSSCAWASSSATARRWGARGACGSPSGPRTRTRHSSPRVRRSPARLLERPNQDGRRHDDRDAAGRDRGAGAPCGRADPAGGGAGAPVARASSSRSSARSATTARSWPRCSSRASPGVEKVVPILKPYKLVSSDFRGHDAVVEVAGRPDRRRRLRPHRRAVRGGVARADPRLGPRLQGGRGDLPARRRLQAPHLALRLLGSAARPASRSWPRRARRPACRS